jgi:hypothetical protein
MNQVLTLHGLNVYLESSGFRRGLGLVGAAAGALIGLVPGLSPAWIAIGSPLGALYGGFFIPFHRWLFTRVRDAILFGPQLVLHTLGQIMRQTIEFVASGAAATDPQGVNMDFRAGAGPREDQPMNRFPHFINLRTVVWCIGLPSVLCILLALSELDMFNVLLLLPSLLFTVSLMIGPFLMSPRPGGYAGVRALLPRLAAWPVALVFYGAVSILVAFGGFASWLGLLLFLVGIAFVVWNPCRALSFRARLAVARHRLARLLINRNVVSSKADAVAVDLIKVSGDPARQGDVLDKAGVPAEARPTVIESIARRIHPLVQEPGATAPGSWSSSRAFSDFSRALVLALFVLLWFLVVPVPGLFVLSAGDFHASLLLEDLIRAVGIALLFCVPGYWIARLLESRLLAANGPNDLRARARQSFQDLQQNILNLSPDDSARRHALLMDFQTYLDQRSPAYAARVLDQLEARKAGR